MNALAQALLALLPPGCTVGSADPTRRHPLLPGETLPKATPARLREFAAGRAAARAALGMPGQPIPMAPDRSPVWPPGIAASITHTATLALAAASRDLRGLGIDLEPATPLDADLWDSILTPDERARVLASPAPGLAAKRIFSAKEAAYKAQYPASRTLFDFDALQIDGLTATFQRGYPPFRPGDRLHGAQVETDGHILTAFWF